MIIFTDNILVTMELLAESLRGWGSAYYNVFSPKGVQLYGGNLPQGNSDEHQFCLPKNACSTILMQSQGKNTEIGRLIDAYIHRCLYFISSLSLFFPLPQLLFSLHSLLLLLQEMEFNDIKTFFNIFLLFLFILLRKSFYFLLSSYFLT